MSATGSVRRDGERGTWLYVVDLPSPDGRRKQVFKRGFSTKKEAQAALTRLLADAQRGTYVPADKVTLRTFLLEEWLPARLATLRTTTAATYEQIIRNYVLPDLGAARLQSIDGSALNRLYGKLLAEGRTESRRRRGPGLSPKTVRNVHGVLTRSFRDGVRWGRLQRNPCDAADPPRGQAPEMRSWSADELRRFTKAVSSHRWAGVWALMATTGMRRGEILGLRWSDVDLEARTVSIRATRVRFGNTITTSTPKTARGNRTIALGPATVAALRTWKRAQLEERVLLGPGWHDTDLVVTAADGSPPNPEAFSNLFHKLADGASLPRIRLHDLRHSYATAALAAGVAVKVLSQRVGHADVGVTLKVYAHVMPGDDEDAARRADALLGDA